MGGLLKDYASVYLGWRVGIREDGVIKSARRLTKVLTSRVQNDFARQAKNLFRPLAVDLKLYKVWNVHSC